MVEKRQVDFKKFASPSGSKMYLLKIVFYITLLGGLIYLVKSKSHKATNSIEGSPNEIKNITIDTLIIN